VQHLELVTQDQDLNVLVERALTPDTEHLDSATDQQKEEREGHGETLAESVWAGQAGDPNKRTRQALS
jgi:hypothetical protein